MKTSFVSVLSVVLKVPLTIIISIDITTPTPFLCTEHARCAAALKFHFVTDGFGREIFASRLPIDGPHATTPGAHAHHRVRRLRAQRPRQHGLRATGNRVSVETATATASSASASATATASATTAASS